MLGAIMGCTRRRLRRALPTRFRRSPDAGADIDVRAAGRLVEARAQAVPPPNAGLVELKCAGLDAEAMGPPLGATV
jgi:hypothetical protein